VLSALVIFTRNAYLEDLGRPCVWYWTPWHLSRTSVCEYKCLQYQPMSLQQGNVARFARIVYSSACDSLLFRCRTIRQAVTATMLGNLSVRKWSVVFRRHAAEAVGTPWAMQMGEVTCYHEELWAGAFVTTVRSPRRESGCKHEPLPLRAWGGQSSRSLSTVQCTHCIRTRSNLHSDCGSVFKTCISWFLVLVSIGMLRVSARCPLRRLRARKVWRSWVHPRCDQKENH
jgi:hypothetical protein